MSVKRTVLFGLLGSALDSGHGPARWEKWRPTVSLCQHDDFVVDRFELLTDRKFLSLAGTVADDMRRVSPETEVRPHTVGYDDAWDFQAVYAALLDFARAYPFDPEREDYFVHITTGSHVAQICLFLLTEARYFPAKLIQTSPPRRFKPGGDPGPGRYDVIDLDLSKYDALAARFDVETRQSTSFLKSGIATRNAAFNRLIDQIERVAGASAAPLLLTGPTGAGKSRLARRIYELKKSRRTVDGAFVEVNCATLRGDGAGSALFGHVKGAFTGAITDRTGLLKSADTGLLFLDEIGELGLDEQAMLLRAVEEKRFLPVGSDKESSSDFQLIAGTNRDLTAAVREGRFREDLLARINLWPFRLPALRERPEDIEPNLDYELEQYALRHGTKVTLNKEARQRFLAFATDESSTWSGNFRDLNAAVTRLATLAAGARVTVGDVDDEIERLRCAWAGHTPDTPADAGGCADLETLKSSDGTPLLDVAALDRFDRVQLADVIAVCRGAKSLSAAGRELFAVSRAGRGSTNDADRLRKYLARFGLDFASVTTIR